MEINLDILMILPGEYWQLCHQKKYCLNQESSLL